MLVTFLAFASCFIIAILFVAWRYLPSNVASTTVPGLTSNNKLLGNLANIREEGGLAQFLFSLNGQHGPVSSFWLGEYLAISLGGQPLIRQSEAANGSAGTVYGSEIPQLLDLIQNTEPSAAYSSPFQTQCSPIILNFRPFGVPVADSEMRQFVTSRTQELCSAWAKFSPEDHLPLGEFMTALAVKLAVNPQTSERLSGPKGSQLAGKLLQTFVALSHKLDECQELSIAANYQALRSELDEKAGAFFATIKSELNVSEQEAVSIGSRLFGEITVLGNLLTWCLFYLASESDHQEQVRMNQRSFLSSFIKEVLRITAFIPFAARINKKEMNILGHIIEPGTLMFHALSAVAWCSNVFPEPFSFEPERFSMDIPMLNPLGLVLPSDTYEDSYSLEACMTAVITILHNYEISLATPLEKDMGPLVKHGLVAKPFAEVWIKLAPASATGNL